MFELRENQMSLRLKDILEIEPLGRFLVRDFERYFDRRKAEIKVNAIKIRKGILTTSDSKFCIGTRISLYV